eukprot:8262718-Pyramimonas_sp.AAC.2
MQSAMRATIAPTRFTNAAPKCENLRAVRRNPLQVRHRTRMRRGGTAAPLGSELSSFLSGSVSGKGSRLDRFETVHSVRALSYKRRYADVEPKHAFGTRSP